MVHPLCRIGSNRSGQLGLGKDAGKGVSVPTKIASLPPCSVRDPIFVTMSLTERRIGVSGSAPVPSTAALYHVMVVCLCLGAGRSGSSGSAARWTTTTRSCRAGNQSISRRRGAAPSPLTPEHNFPSCSSQRRKPKSPERGRFAEDKRRTPGKKNVKWEF